MTKHNIEIRNIQNVSELNVSFDFSESNIIVVTGRNGIGKTTLVRALNLIKNPKIFEDSEVFNAIKNESRVTFDLDGFESFTYSYSSKLKALDCKDRLPKQGMIAAELPIPMGQRFKQFSLISSYDTKLRENIASLEYQEATELIAFLRKVYSSDKFSGLKVTKIGRHNLYFIPNESGYYIREDHFSSGEYFLVQIFRLVTSGAKLIIIDEIDVALDASAQVNLFSSLKCILDEYGSKLIVISHSLAFMETAEDGTLYYLEGTEGVVSLERRSFGYIKSDLYGFRGKDRYILTEDSVLVDFLNYLINKHVDAFFKYEIIPVGGKPQIKTMAAKNDSHKVFGEPEQVIVVVDKDIFESIGYKGSSKIYHSPVEDIEVFIWKNRERLLPDVVISDFKEARKEKKTAKTYWGKVIGSRQKTTRDLYELVEFEHPVETEFLIGRLKEHLCLD